MWSSLRRVFCTVVLVAGLTCVTLLHLAQAQRQPTLPVQPQPKDGGKGTDLDKNIALPRDKDLQRKMEDGVQDYIKTEDWANACQLLQFIVEGEQDAFLSVKRLGADGSEKSVDVSIKKEANRLLAGLPPKGLEFYKLTYGQTAADKLKEAKEKHNRKLLEEVSRNYQNTDAGLEATDLLARYLLDAGNFNEAADYYQRLFERAGVAKVSSLSLFHAAYAFHQTGNLEHESRAWRELSNRGRDVRLGNKLASIEELKDYVRTRGSSVVQTNEGDWLLVNGSANRNARGRGDIACMEARYTINTVEPPNPPTTDAEKNAIPMVETAYRAAVTSEQQTGQAVFSGCSPVAATYTRGGERFPVVVYRSPFGIHMIDVRTGRQSWYMKTSLSLLSVFERVNDPLVPLLTQVYQPHLPALPFENSTTGTVSIHGNMVYFIDDVPAAPTAPLIVGFQPNPQGMTQPGAVGQILRANRLMAMDLPSGKLVWSSLPVNPPQGEAQPEAPFSDTIFLGSPLPLSNRLFALAEHNQELQLVTLDPATGRLVQRQLLGRTRDRLTQDGPRRSRAAHLAAGEGMLICPTNAGAIFGYDLLDKSLAWAYHYREPGGPFEAPRVVRNPQGTEVVQWAGGQYYKPRAINSWKVTPPIIQDGKVIFTAPDSTSVHCLALRDGSPLWSVKRGDDDYYLAGVWNGKVLIVGKKTVKALDLATGKQVWATSEAGVPSGIGTASENLYYLPVKEGASKQPEIVAIDIDTGAITGRARSRREVPGNLIFFEGNVISQGATELTVYPQLRTRLAEIDEKIRKNPRDPAGLTDRGELRLDRGELRGAVEDLVSALDNMDDTTPPALRTRARSRLFDALTIFLLKDFDGAEKYLPRYDDLCTKVDAMGRSPADLEKERRRRKVFLLILVGRGKEGQRKLVEAFHTYEELSALVVGPEDLITPPDEPKVLIRPDMLARGRIAALMAGASAEERRPVEELVAARWVELKKNGTPEDRRRFVTRYGALFEAGREARLFLANQLSEDGDASSLLEAERQLTLLRHQSGGDRRMAARAVEALARLNLRKGLLEDAGYYYTLLNREYGKEDLGGGRTGADVYNDAATDKRLRPYLDRQPGLGGAGALHFDLQRNNPPRTAQKIYHFEPVGERLPWFRSHEVTVRVDEDKLVVTDPVSGKEWVEPLVQTQFKAVANSSAAKAPILTLGHLVVLRLGPVVMGVDPIQHKVLWKKDLQSPLIGPANAAPGLVTLHVDERDGSVQMLYPDGWMQQLGVQTGPLQGDAIYLQSKGALVALDPLTGDLLWARTDLPPRSHLFGDDQNLYVVEQSTNNASTARAVRASDGSTVKVPDFTSAYQNRLKVLGRHLLVADGGTAPRGDAEKGAPPTPVVLRLYDVPTGKDLWSVRYEAGTRVLEAETSDYVGVVDSKGMIHIHDVQTGREFATDKVADSRDLEGTSPAYLLADRDQVYVLFNRPLDRTEVAANYSILTNVMPGTGLRALPVNGSVHAFARDNGKLRWVIPVLNQMVVLERFEDLPVLLFTSRYQQVNRPNPSTTREAVKIWCMEKKSGKALLDSPVLEGRQSQFFALHVDSRSGRIEFVSELNTAVITPQ